MPWRAPVAMFLLIVACDEPFSKGIASILLGELIALLITRSDDVLRRILWKARRWARFMDHSTCYCCNATLC